jgi:uncharacterized protein
MHQFIMWTALTAAGNGANLQHYNPLVDEETKATWDIPSDWTLMAQLGEYISGVIPRRVFLLTKRDPQVFGKPTTPPGPKSTHMKKPLEERMFVHGELSN